MSKINDQLRPAISVLEEAQTTLTNRQIKYGAPSVIFQEIAEAWTPIFGVTVTPEDVCLAMILMKVVRYKNGSKDRDSLVDICGYAALVGQLRSNDREN